MIDSNGPVRTRPHAADQQEQHRGTASEGTCRVGPTLPCRVPHRPRSHRSRSFTRPTASRPSTLQPSVTTPLTRAPPARRADPVRAADARGAEVHGPRRPRRCGGQNRDHPPTGYASTTASNSDRSNPSSTVVSKTRHPDGRENHTATETGDDCRHRCRTGDTRPRPTIPIGEPGSGGTALPGWLPVRSSRVFCRQYGPVERPRAVSSRSADRLLVTLPNFPAPSTRPPPT